MPNPEKFLKAFKLNKIPNFKLYDHNIQHNVITRYYEYEYLGTLYYEPSNYFEIFKKEFSDNISKSIIVDSDYKNPYRCSVNSVRFKKRDSDIVVTFVGHAIRA